MKAVFSLILFSFISLGISSQQIFESNIIYGGVTGGGFSTNTGSGTISTSVLIPPNSSIKKAYLLATRNCLAPNFTPTLNGVSYTFSNETIISEDFISISISSLPWICTNSTIHAIEITSDIDSSINNYSLYIPPQTNITVNGHYSHFYLYIIYENPLLAKINYNLHINNQDVKPLSTYNLDALSPINNSKPIGLELFNYFFCDTIQDGSYISINGNTIGLLGGQEPNTINTCTGVYSNFSHYNDSLFGLEDDTPDSLMAGTDALADIKSYVSNGDTTINIIFTYQTPNLQNGFLTNPVAAIMLSYTTPCDTFTTSITANDTICLGESVQLQATGGVNYSWFGAFGGLNDTAIANPMASPPQTTTYICTITNDSGCVKTEQVKIWVNPWPVADTLIVTPNTCGDTVGSITVGNINNNALPYNYQLTNLQTLATQNSTLNSFIGLGTANYELLITDNNGCQFTDTVTINQTNNVTANFTANPANGSAPLLVNFDNTSANANLFKWSISEIASFLAMTGPKDTIVQNTTFNIQHLFDSAGTYELCLIAYNNIPTCADTVCKTILIDEPQDSLILIIPNIFTPNFDGENDEFAIQINGAKNLQSLNVQIFNRWGIKVGSWELGVGSSQQKASTTAYTLWNGTTTAGKTCPEGTYFYVINYKIVDNELKSKKGSVTLLR